MQCNYNLFISAVDFPNLQNLKNESDLLAQEIMSESWIKFYKLLNFAAGTWRKETFSYISRRESVE